MKTRLQRLAIQNFKAFRHFEFNLEGRHLLVYGANGSGKSSLYWALYTFLQSARKPTSGVAKYFDPAAPERLLNLYEEAEPTPRPGEIALTLRDTSNGNETTYRISQTHHGTHQQPAILKGDLASDFITYRFFFGFSHFRNSQAFDVWPLFEKEILPFCVATGGQVPLECWEAIKDGNPNPSGSRGRGGAAAYTAFAQKVTAFGAMLTAIVDTIGVEAQRFYDEHFSAGDPAKVDLRMRVTSPPSFSGTNQATADFRAPVVEFGIQIGGKTVNRPQAFLNEAKLTQLALSVRFAASLVNLHDSDLKLLVLDDLLVSLDMSNRMKVVEILLSETFANYQKVILTHERGFFHEFRRALGPGHSEWSLLRLEGHPDSSISARSEKSDLQKAEDYLHGHDLDEAALCLRKACEDIAKRFVDGPLGGSGKFVSLTDALRAARNKVLTGLPLQFYERVVRETPDAHRKFLIAATDADIDGETSLDAPSRGRLKTSRRRLRQMLQIEHVERLRQAKLIDDILHCTERVLNPAAHSGNPPLYETEVAQALALVRQLDDLPINQA
jgi:energy-coupling factor transporter ATP-binding protein EcfA2